MLSHPDDVIPVHDTLGAIYSAERVPQEQTRWDALNRAFAAQYGVAPDFVARAPGRVNMIGEHVDHQGFSVLPASIEMDILMATHVVWSRDADAAAASPNQTTEFVLHNVTPRFERTSFSTAWRPGLEDVQLHNVGPDRWANYFKVALKGLFPHLPEGATAATSPKPVRVEILVDGTVPPESSLSSSAAMTTVSSILILEALGVRAFIDRKEMANVAIESERLVGVSSGGMDQSASIFGQPGYLLHIGFVPSLWIHPILAPHGPTGTESYKWLIANTLVVSDKKVTGPIHYNLRTAELRMATRAMGRALGIAPTAHNYTINGLLGEYYSAHPVSKLWYLESDERAEQLKEAGEEGVRIGHFESLALAHIPQHPVTRAEAEALTGYAGAAFTDEFLTTFPVQADTFDLYKRAKHVFDEAYRTLRFVTLLQVAAARTTDARPGEIPAQDAATLYAQLGALINQSHYSMRDLYEASCPELEQVTTIAREAGALGARLTGTFSVRLPCLMQACEAGAARSACTMRIRD